MARLLEERHDLLHGASHRLVGDPPTLNSPASNVRLAPHSSRYRSLLIADYRSRELKPRNEAYSSNDFSLCYLCHSEAPFSTNSQDPRADTYYRLHGLHLTGIPLWGSVGNGLDINTPGAGQGNAVCAECHFETHSTKLAPWAGNQNNSSGVNFGPNVLPRDGAPYPYWDVNTQTCTLTCHGKDHDNYEY